MTTQLRSQRISPLRKICNSKTSACRLDALVAYIVLATMTGSAGAYADSGAVADDPHTRLLLLSGFGTLGVVHSSEEDADFTSSIFKPNGAGHTHTWSADVDSNIAGQVVANVTSQLSGMVQVISQQRYDGSYRPYVEWANIKYQFTSDFSVRVGRIVLPSFLFSDTRNIGYANAWVRPPVEVYGLVPVANSDGVDASYRFQIGEVIQTVLGTYGKTMNQTPQGGAAEARRQWIICDTVEYGALTAHIAYQEAHLTIDSLNTFFDAFRSFGQQGVAIAEEFDQHNKPLSFIGLGAIYSPGKWFMAGEWGTSEFHSALGKRTAWYVSGGYRFGKLTPYLNYAVTIADGPGSDPGLNTAALSPQLAGRAFGLNAGLNAILGSSPAQNTTSLGVRWDLAEKMDIKLQYNRTRLDEGSAGTFINLQPGFQPGSAVNLFSAVFDFVL
jgi:hypothetical protein